MPVSAFASLLLVLGLGLGVLGDGLLNIRPWGLNVPIWCGLAAAAIVGIHRAMGLPLSMRLRLALGAWVGLSLLFAWRDADELRVLNLLALTVATGFLLGELQPKVRAPLDWVTATALKLGATIWRAFDVLETWRRTRTQAPEAVRERRAAMLRGVLICLPVVGAFGALLAGADAAFSAMATNLLDWSLDVESIVSHVAGFVVVAWISLGLLSASGASHLATPRPTPAPSVAFDVGTPAVSSPKARIGLTEVSFVLGSLCLLFGAFVALQFTYLFGGGGQVQLIGGLSYADYARRGFFELVWVLVFSLPVLLACHKVAQRSGSKGLRIFLSLGGIVITLLLVIGFSAWTRMQLYIDAYGLTNLRLYACAAMAWIGLTLVWLLYASGKGMAHRFAPGAAILALTTITLLNGLNPDLRIAQFNLSRASRKGELDLGYLGTLSLDAAPAMESSLSAQRATWRPGVYQTWVRLQNQVAERDWRSWTWSEFRSGRQSSSSRGSLAFRIPQRR